MKKTSFPQNENVFKGMVRSIVKEELIPVKEELVQVEKRLNQKMDQKFDQFDERMDKKIHEVHSDILTMKDEIMRELKQ